MMDKKTINALHWMVNILGKHDIPYQIAGGFAAKMYGSTRPLNDIDFDVSEKYFPLILPEISKYIIFGPARSNDDGKWDCQLITLNYHGQEIDISGADTLKMSNKERTKWISFGDKPLNTIDMKVEGCDIKVIHPRELVEYKKELDGEHQLIDIKATKDYIHNHKL